MRDEYFEDFGVPLPDDEHVRVPCIWLCEFYLPTHTVGLRRGLSRLSLADKSIYPGGPSIIDYLTDRRLRAEATEPRPLGELVRAREDGAIRPVVCGELPTAAHHVGVSCWFPTPSVTCLLFQCALGEDSRGVLDSILHRSIPDDYPEEAFRRAAHSPGFDQVEGQLQTARRELRRGLEDWLSETVPGAFAEGRGNAGYASCELVTTVKATPFEPLADGGLCRYLSLLGLHDSGGAYVLAEGDLRAYPPPTWARDDGCLVLAGREGELIESVGADSESVGASAGSWGNLHLLGVDKLAWAWGTCFLARTQYTRLARLRDVDWGELGGDRAQKSGKVLARLRPVLPTVAQATLVSDELRTLWASDGFVGTIPDGTAMRQYGAPQQLAEWLKDATLDATDKLERISAWLREALGSAASLLATAANLRLQRRILCVSIVAMLIAVASVVLSAVLGCDTK